MQQPTTMPGLRGTEHIGFTVPDLEQAVRFFVNVIGCELVYEMGPFQFEDGWMKANLDLDPGTVLCKVQLLRCGHGSNFEIFEFTSPQQVRRQPRNSDIGGHHLAFYVDDIEAAVAHLRANDVHVLGEPKASGPGPSAGQTFVYFLSPWGMQLELVSFPQGKAYEQAATRWLWHPASPQR